MSAQEGALLQALAKRRQKSVSLVRDRALLESLTTRPAKLLSGMKQKGLLIWVEEGVYVVASWAGDLLEQSVSPFAALDAWASPRGRYFVSFLSAVVEHQLTDEASWSIHVAVGDEFRVPDSTVEIAARPVDFTTLKGDDRMQGAERIRTEGREGYWRATLERTLVDTMLKPAKSGGLELVSQAWARAARRELDMAELARLSKLVSKSVARRVATMLVLVDLAEAADLHFAELRRPDNTVLLDASKEFGTSGTRMAAWGVRLNCPSERLRGWVRT